jgi:ERCC4-type nuclease
MMLLAEDHKDLNVEICALPTADYENQYMIIESKSVSDFVSSITQRIPRKDGTIYERLTEQVERMLSSDKPIRIILIHGDLEDLHSGINHNSIRGMIASIVARGLTVLWVPKDFNYPDLVMRLHFKSLKYGGERV